jgi:aspartyl/asparaginyl-tRNA synthetase
LGETTGGAVREEDGEKIKDYLLNSRVAKYIQEQGGDPLEPFQEYFNLFEQEQPTVRGGFGIGFERFVGFLLNSNDILDTIAYRAMQPF